MGHFYSMNQLQDSNSSVTYLWFIQVKKVSLSDLPRLKETLGVQSYLDILALTAL